MPVALWDEIIKCDKCQKNFISYDAQWILMPPKAQVFYTEISCPYCDHYDIILLKSKKPEEQNVNSSKSFLNLLKGILK